MTTTVFTNGSTLTDAGWFNDVNTLIYTDHATGTTASTFTFDGGGGSTGSLTLTWQRFGNWVTLSIPTAQATTGTGSTVLASNTALAAAVRPVSKQELVYSVGRNNGASVAGAGLIQVQTTGIISIYRDNVGTAYTNAASGGTSGNMCISYFIG